MVIDSSGNVVLGSSANGGQAMTTLQGYSPNSANGSYGNLLFSANANYTGGASRFLLTNAFNVTDFAIISSVDATTTPTLDSGGAVSSGTVVFSLKAGGNAAFLGNIGIGGATPSSSGAGITFPATQSASSDANTLDDYEEGTWTPAWSATGTTFTMPNQVGRYVKVGGLVTAYCYLNISAVSGTKGAATLTGLPFNTENVANAYASICIGQMYNIDWPADAKQLTGHVLPNDTKVQMIWSRDATTTSALTGAELESANTGFMMGISYRV
jgi:hypothetical protein